MKSQFYAVVDAGGNIYEHSFCKKKDGALFQHIVSKLNLNKNGPIEVNYYNELVQGVKENGDRVVLCDIETNENVKITIKD